MTFDLSIALQGAVRCFIGFPLEHPLRIGIIANQLDPAQTSYVTVKKMLHERGLFGIYKGSLANLGKSGLKDAYRWQCLSIFHQFWARVIPKKASFGGLSEKIATGATLAATDTIVVLPLEALLAWKIKYGKYSDFFTKRIKGEGFLSVYSGASGLSATFSRHMVMWSAFMTTNHLVKSKIKEIDPKNRFPLISKIFASVICAASITFFGLPVDFVRTQILVNAHLQKMSITGVVKILWEAYGIRGFYAATGLQLAHSSVHAILGGGFLDRITQSRGET